MERSINHNTIVYKIIISALSVITIVGIAFGVISNLNMTSPNGEYENLLIEKQELLIKQDGLEQSIKNHSDEISAIKEKYQNLENDYNAYKMEKNRRR